MNNPEDRPLNLVDSTVRQIGSLEVGPLAFGMWRYTNTDIGEATTVLETAIESGFNLIDTADVYGLDWGGTAFGQAEEILGAVLKASPNLRQQFTLATKGGIAPPTPYNSSDAYLRQALDDSLRRLNVEQVDLYQIHRPDYLTHPAALAETLQGFVSSGKVLEVGVSNYNTTQTRALAKYLGDVGIRLASSQPEFSALELSAMRDGTLDLCMEYDITPLAWSPLAGGRLATGDELSAELNGALTDLADRENATKADIAVAFVLAHPSRPIAILGSQTPERITAASKALRVELSRDDIYKIVQASEGAPLP